MTNFDDIKIKDQFRSSVSGMKYTVIGKSKDKIHCITFLGARIFKREAFNSLEYELI